MTLTIGTRVTLKDAYLDERGQEPVTGTIGDIYPRPDWNGMKAYVVTFDHTDPKLPGGGEFTANWLIPLADGRGS